MARLAQIGVEKDYWVEHLDERVLVLQGSFDRSSYVDLEVRFCEPSYVMLPTVLRRHLRIERPTLALAQLVRARMEPPERAPPVLTAVPPSFFVLRSARELGFVCAEEIELRVAESLPYWSERHVGDPVEIALAELVKPPRSEAESYDLPDATLLAIVQRHAEDDAVAARALLELEDRAHPWLRWLAEWIVAESSAGPLIKARSEEILARVR